MLKKLVVCFFVLVCVLAFTACGGNEPEEYEFKPGTNYNEDLEAREHFLKETVKILEGKFSYDGNDHLGYVISDEVALTRVCIENGETAERFFECLRNSKIYDYSGKNEGCFPEYHPPYSDIELCASDGSWQQLGGYQYMDIHFQPTGQFFHFEFSEDDAENFREYLLSLNEAGSFPRIYENEPTARNVLLEGVVRDLEAELSVVMGEEDVVELWDDMTYHRLQRFEIKTKESAEQLFACVRNAEAIFDISGISAVQGVCPIEIGYLYKSSFRSLVIYNSDLEKNLYIRFTEADAERLRDYVDALALSELPEGIQQGSVLEERLYP